MPTARSGPYRGQPSFQSGRASIQDHLVLQTPRAPRSQPRLQPVLRCGLSITGVPPSFRLSVLRPNMHSPSCRNQVRRVPSVASALRVHCHNLPRRYQQEAQQHLGRLISRVASNCSAPLTLLLCVAMVLPLHAGIGRALQEIALSRLAVELLALHQHPPS